VSDWTGLRSPELTGTWKARFRGRRDGEVARLAARLDLPDLTAPPLSPDGERLDLATSATLQVAHDASDDTLEVQDLKVWGDVATIDISGTIEAPMGRRLADLQGTFVLNEGPLQRFLADRVEPEARIIIQPRPLHLRGPLSGPSLAAVLRGLDAEIGADVEFLDIYGMKLGPMPLVARARSGRVTIDPISTTLNGGRVDLRPGVLLDDRRGVFLTLAPGWIIQGARINEEVSRRFLSYAVPVLYKATSVRGDVSVRIDRAVVPIATDDEAEADVRGVVGFQDVTFHGGPLGRQILGLVRLEDLAFLRLDQDVPFRVLGDRVYQPGMSVPLAKLAVLDLAGSVGLDRSLDLDLDVPIVPDILDRVPVAGNIVGGLKIKVPVRGTLNEPIVDKEEFDAGMKRMGQGIGQRGRAVGEGILDRLRQFIPVIPEIKRDRQL
jgi:translocation and assembly module TamB